MRRSAQLASLAVTGLLIAGGGLTLLVMNGSSVSAQTPPAPCACSRATPLIGADDISPVPGQMQPRYGMIHCQCGAATCVSQVAYGSVGIPQLYCVK